MKRKYLLLTMLLTIAGLSSCAKKATGNTKQLDAPSEFRFDFEKAEYSFTGSTNATFYSLKVYQYVDDTLDTHAISSSGMIRATKENKDYKGTINYDFTAGKYRAVIKALAPRYKSNETTVEGNSMLLGSPTVTAKWNDPSQQPGGGMGPGPMAYTPLSEKDTQALSIDVTITAGDSITKDYTMSVTNTTLGKEVYRNEKISAGTTNLKFEDFNGITELTDDDDYSVTVVGNTFDNYVIGKTVTTNVVSSGNGFTFKISKFSFDKGAKEFTFNLGKTEMMMGATATLANTPASGAIYTYNILKKTGAPFNLEGTLDINSDNTAVLKMESVGPVQGGTFNGTWTEADGKIQVSKLVK